MSPGLVLVLGCLACADGALAQSAKAQQAVPLAEQAARDNDRLEILRQELKKSEALVTALERRRSERLAAADAQGASEAEEQRGRTLSDIAGLQRELTVATRSSVRDAVSTEDAATTKAAPTKPLSRRLPSSAPWWDVYGKARRIEAPAAIPSPVSVAPAEAGPRTVSARRPE